jgi:glutamate racemase
MRAVWTQSEPMSQRDQPVGLFDSGVGGCSVLTEVRRLLPGEDLIYLADQAHCPYGARAIEEIRALALGAAGWLIARGAKAVVVACNSASAAALAALRERFPDTPFIGMVPAVKPAAMATRSGVVGVLATPATLTGGLMQDVVARWGSHVRVLTQPCAGLADLVEAGRAETPEAAALVDSYVRPLIDAGADTLVLGCTHYPFLAAQIGRAAGPHVALVDPAPAVARQLQRVLAERQLLSGRPVPGAIRYATTGDPGALAATLARLGMPPGAAIEESP